MEVLYCSEFSNRRKPGGKLKFGISGKRSFIVKENVLILRCDLTVKEKPFSGPASRTSKSTILQSDEVNGKDVVQVVLLKYPAFLIYYSVALNKQYHDKHSRFSSLENKFSAQDYGVTAQYSGFMQQVSAFYSNALATNEVLSGLAVYSVTRTDLEKGSELVKVYQEKRREQLWEISEAQSSTEERIRRFASWMNGYRILLPSAG